MINFTLQFWKSSLVSLNLDCIKKNTYTELKDTLTELEDTLTILSEVIEKINSCENLKALYELLKEFDIKGYENKATNMFIKLQHLSSKCQKNGDLQWSAFNNKLEKMDEILNLKYKVNFYTFLTPYI